MTTMRRIFNTSRAASVPTILHEVRTFNDLVERLLGTFDIRRSGAQRALVLARQAVLDAYRELPTYHDWTYSTRTHSFQTDADYTTGTIAYDHTGGTYERQLTLTSGTWPTNAAYGTVIIANQHYPVESRVSATVVTLSQRINPGADVAASTSYIWYRDAYGLPSDYLANGRLVEAGENTFNLDYVEPQKALDFGRLYGDTLTNKPEFWTIQQDQRYINGLCLVLVRGPNEARTYEFTYHGQGQPLQTEKYATGTVSITSGSATLTGSSTAFTSRMEGSVIRFSADANLEPTPPEGYISAEANLHNPSVEEAVIHAVASGTSATLDRLMTQTLSGVRYVISDPLDIDMAIQYSPLAALAEYHYARKTNRTDVARYREHWIESLMHAKEADYRNRAVQAQSGILVANWGTVDGVPS